MSAWPWVGVVVGGMVVLGGLSLSGYGAWQSSTTEPEGRQWSQEELYECELAPSCDEAAAAEEARLWRETDSQVELVFAGMMLLMVGMLIEWGSLHAASPRFRRWFRGGSL